MNAGLFFIRAWRAVAIFGFLFSLFNSYISYPGDVAVRFNSIGQAVQYVSRETIFYVAVGLFLVIYTVIGIVVRNLSKLPASSLLLINGQQWAAYRGQLLQHYKNWFRALEAAFYTILALALMVMSFLNRSDRTTAGASDYAWLLPLSTLVLIIVLVSLPIRLFMKPDVED